MLNILEHTFMQNAFIAGILLGIVIPCLGTVIVYKRLSMIGDALSHSSLAGVAAGLLTGINPLVGAIGACLAAAFSIEFIRRKIPGYGEISIAVIMSGGIGLAGVLSGLSTGAASFNNFLFGSIVAISSFEVRLIAATSMIVLLLFICLYKELFLASFDQRAAFLSGAPAQLVDFIFTLMVAVIVSVASRTIGALIVSSMLVLPVACGLEVSGSYKQTIIFSALFGVAFTIAGLTVSFYTGLRPGGTISLLGVACFILLLSLRTGGLRMQQPFL